jgi:NAD(P)H dehydrogenase (quinone)
MAEVILEKVGLTLMKVGEALGIPNLDPESGLIFVTGGNGVVGHRVATKLLRAGYPQVRLGAHSPTEFADKNKDGAEIADFDWSRTDTYDKALVGVKSVLCTAPYMKGWKKKFPFFLEACRNAGVKHFIKLSFYHARLPGDPFQNVPLVRAHGECDELLAKSDLPYTILGASHMMSNPMTLQGHELRMDQKPAVLYGASLHKGVNYVSPNDIADVTVHILLDPRSHHNREYTLTGPEPIKDQQVAQLLSDYLKKPIMYVDQPLHTFQEGERMSGDPEWLVEDLMKLEMVKASGYEEDPHFVSNDIEQICGHPAETFDAYLLMTEAMTPMEI